MKRYKLLFEKKGMMTSLPDSQRLFGWLCSYLTSINGKQKTSDFVERVFLGEKKFMLSNMLPEGYLPMPKAYFIDNAKKCGPDHEAMYKQLRGKDYIKREDLEMLLKKIERKEDWSLNSAYFSSQVTTYVQKLGLESQREQLPGLPNKSYAVPVVDIRKQGQRKESINQFFVWIQTDDDLVQKWLCKMAKKEARVNERVCLGSRVSQGYNHFDWISTEEENADALMDGDKFLNLGMLLPGKIQYLESLLELHTSVRKPFEVYRGEEKYISFIREGSIVSAGNSFEAGRCIKNDQNLVYNNAILFGKSFLIPLSELGGYHEKK